MIGITRDSPPNTCLLVTVDTYLYIPLSHSHIVPSYSFIILASFNQIGFTGLTGADLAEI